MEFNDGSVYRQVTDPSKQLAQRTVYAHRAASARSGVPYVDSSFAAHRQALAGMQALVFYQYVWANAGTPEAQAQFLVDALGGRLAANEMVMLDIETGGGIADPAGFARRWLGVVETQLRTRAWLYVPGGLAEALAPVVAGRVVMAPRYGGPVPTWPHDVHQYTDAGPFPGCSQPGDTSRTALTAQQMLARCYPERNEMPSSYNGWSAGPGWSVAAGQLQPLSVAGESFPPGVRAGDVHDVFQYLVENLHARVEPVVRADWNQADDWGYSYRANVNNPSTLSCHASGTAIDYNATRHPNGKSGTFPNVPELRKILAELDGVVQWGGDFTGTKDEMHFEIKGTAAKVAAVAAKVRGGGGGGTSVNDPNDDVLEVGDSGPAVTALQEVLLRWYPSQPWGAVDNFADGEFGPTTDKAVRYFQGKAGLTVDGQVGAASRAALGLKPPAEYKDTPAPPETPKLAFGGEIAAAYARLPQGLRDELGPLTQSERTVPGGAVAPFTTGAFYWTPEGGAFHVRGGVFQTYAGLGWEGSKLGFPRSDEFNATITDRNGQPRAVSLQLFQGGSIVWDPASGAQVISR